MHEQGVIGGCGTSDEVAGADIPPLFTKMGDQNLLATRGGNQIPQQPGPHSLVGFIAWNGCPKVEQEFRESPLHAPLTPFRGINIAFKRRLSSKKGRRTMKKLT